MKLRTINIALTPKEMNVLANALESKIKQLEEDTKLDYTPDTKTPLRQLARKHLNDAKQVNKKIHFLHI